VLTEIGVFRRERNEMRVVPAWRYDTGPADGWDELGGVLGPHVDRDSL
jgi:hypothetical protein